jgi:hypothetical protein
MAAMEKNPERQVVAGQKQTGKSTSTCDAASTGGIAPYCRAMLRRSFRTARGQKKDCYGARSKIGIFHGTLDFKTGFHDTPLKPGS